MEPMWRAVVGARVPGLLLAGLALCACVTAAPGGPAPGTLTEASFGVTSNRATQYGPSSTLACPTGGLFVAVADELADAAKAGGRAAPIGDGRLCAIAETLSSYPAGTTPPESVRRFIAWHFGTTAPSTRVVISRLESISLDELAPPLVEILSGFAERAVAPRFGLYAEQVADAVRGRKGATKVTLVMQDEAIDWKPFATAVAAGADVPMSGQLLGTYSEATLRVSDPAGKLETIPQAGKALAATVHCGPKAGLMRVEVSVDSAGVRSALARFPVSCGTTWAPAVGLAPPQPATASPEAGAKHLLELVNVERAEASLPPLAWDEAVAKVAVEAAQKLAEGGGAGAFDVEKRLRDLHASTPLVLQNPASGSSLHELHALVLTSPVNRSNLLDPRITHAGVGVFPVPGPDGTTMLDAVELLVQRQPIIDAEAMRATLRIGIAGKRSAANATAAPSDPFLEELAQTYAKTLADGAGTITTERDDALLLPLYREYRGVSLVSGADAESARFLEAPGVVAAGSLSGVGVAQGDNAILGANAVYVVIFVASKPAPKASTMAPPPTAPAKKPRK